MRFFIYKGSGSVLLIILGVSAALSQTPFVKTFGGDGFEKANAITSTTAGEYLICGHTTTFSFDSNGASIYFVKIDAAGNLIFSKSFGGSGAYDLPTAISSTYDGGAAMTGMTWNYGLGDADVFLLKTDNGGNLEWMKTYGTVSREKAFAMVQTADSGFAITGFAKYDPNYPEVDDKVVLIKTDKSGNLEWTKTYGGTSNEQATSILQASDKGFVLSGFTQSYGAGQNDVYVLKTDSAGNIEWARAIGSPLAEIANGVVQVDNGFLLAGTSDNCGFGNGDILVMRLDTNGAIAWSKCIGTPGLETASKIVQSVTGDIVVTGLTMHAGRDVLVCTIDSQGNLLGAFTFSGEEDEHAADIALSNDSGFVITGYSTINFESFDLLVVKFAADFSARCFAGPLSMNITTTALTVADGVQNFAKEYYEQTHVPMEFATNTFTRDICELSALPAVDTAISSIFPNPFTDYIKVTVIGNGNSNFTIFDWMGRKMYTESFDGETSIDGAILQSGPYYYRLTDNRKLLQTGVLIKQ